MRLVMKLDASEAQKTLAGILSRMGDKRPALRVIAETIRTSVRKTFGVGGRPQQWKQSARAVREGGQTLIKSGRLMNSIFGQSHPDHIEEIRADSVTVGTNVKYAAIHQLGGKIGARVILPVGKKALFWPGARHPVKKVNWPGATIPARPFLAIQDEDWASIKEQLSRVFLAGGKA